MASGWGSQARSKVATPAATNVFQDERSTMASLAGADRSSRAATRTSSEWSHEYACGYALAARKLPMKTKAPFLCAIRRYMGAARRVEQTLANYYVPPKVNRTPDAFLAKVEIAEREGHSTTPTRTRVRTRVRTHILEDEFCPTWSDKLSLVPMKAPTLNDQFSIALHADSRSPPNFAYGSKSVYETDRASLTCLTHSSITAPPPSPPA